MHLWAIHPQLYKLPAAQDLHTYSWSPTSCLRREGSLLWESRLEPCLHQGIRWSSEITSCADVLFGLEMAYIFNNSEQLFLLGYDWKWHFLLRQRAIPAYPLLCAHCKEPVARPRAELHMHKCIDGWEQSPNPPTLDLTSTPWLLSRLLFLASRVSICTFLM